MNELSTLYKSTIMEMMNHSQSGTSITIENVYQEGNKSILPHIDKIISEQLLPNSEIRSFENIEKLYDLVKQGKKCIILVEHYSNFDLPAFSYLLRTKGEKGQEIDSNIVSIAGIKLAEEDPIIRAFSEAYSRLFIYPNRSIEAIEKTISDPAKRAEEVHKSNAINFASMKKLVQLRSNGKLILVFPAGTRYRPWDPSSKKGVREIASYLRSFDYFCMVSLNGNILEVNPDGKMREDIIKKDRIVFDISPVVKCSDFRESVKANLPADVDPKQAVVDAAMAQMDIMHNEVEKTR